VEKRSELSLDRARPDNRGLIEPLCQARRGHCLLVIRPALHELLARNRRRWRLKLAASLEMPEQDGLMARSLPDEVQVRGGGDADDTLVALRCLAELIVVEKDETPGIGFAASAVTFGRPLCRTLDDCQRIAPARLQQHCIEMDRQAGVVCKTSQERNIGLLALAFASDKQSAALRDGPAGCVSSWRSHPIWGTAP
jgi:hypothetical protein